MMHKNTVMLPVSIKDTHEKFIDHIICRKF